MDETIKDIRSTIFALQARGQGRGTADLRAQVLDLVDEMTPALGFAPSLRLGARLAAQAHGEVTEQALMALREALSNAARHSSATRVDVTIDVDHGGVLTVRVADNGTGIPPGGRRSGLRNLADRAAKLGGEMRLEAAGPGSDRPGTVLEWRVPAG
jgi:signal transduction histidine kinase